jgi:hypothetical protein
MPLRAIADGHAQVKAPVVSKPRKYFCCGARLKPWYPVIRNAARSEPALIVVRRMSMTLGE